MAKLANSTKQPLQPSLSFHADSPPPSTGISMSYAETLAILEDFNLETSHRLRTLSKQSQERLDQIERHWTDSLNSLDERVKNMSLERFVKEFAGDVERALSQVVREQVGMRPMGIVEQSARKRKRFMANSPNGKNTVTDDENDLFASTTSKKQRSAIAFPPSSVQKGKKMAPPLSVTRNGSAVKKKVVKGTSLGGIVRKPARLRLRPSTSQSNAPPPSASSSSNFIYRNPLAGSSSAVAPTPQNRKIANGAGTLGSSITGGGATTISRKPRRGESIVIRSLNDSPLGEFVAEESEEEPSSDTLDEEEEGEGGEGDEWDMMEKNEASRAEDPESKKKQSKKNKLKGKGKPPQLPLSPSVPSGNTRVPSSSSFGISLPAGAPSYEELKKKWKEEMLEKLKGLEDSGDLHRKGLESVLGLL
ncbi:hypothetical protein JCM3765_003619 [Sporobolomyces pararoseus]